MIPMTITFLGAGNMGRCLIGGLIANGHPPAAIVAADPNAQQLDFVRERLGVETSADNASAVAGADVIVLAVKPQMMRSVALELAPVLDRSPRPLVVSIAAGVRTEDLRRWLGAAQPLVRAMPNTPALVQAGATALYAAARTTTDQREVAEGILRSVGTTVWVDDELLIDVATAVSGSGPAYFFLLMELIQQAGAKLGLSDAQARQLTVETALGAARMALESGLDPAALRQQVTSPGGTTERALSILADRNIANAVDSAVTGAFERAGELSRLFGCDP